jgi:hypothetical protein
MADLKYSSQLQNVKDWLGLALTALGIAGTALAFSIRAILGYKDFQSETRLKLQSLEDKVVPNEDRIRILEESFRRRAQAETVLKGGAKIKAKPNDGDSNA